MRFHVQNMTCSGCARGVTSAIQSLDPKAWIKIDLDTRFIDLRTATPGPAVVIALETAGFIAVPAP